MRRRRAMGPAWAVALLVLAIPGTATATTLDKRVAASSDDAEEFANGSTKPANNDLELIHDSSDQTVGMRWTALAIPRGATITAAWIQFSAKEAQSEATSLVFRGQAADNAAAFSSGSRNVSSRTRTAAATAWAPAPWSAGQVGASQRTADLSGVIQEIVNRAGWASGNALVVIVTGSGHRTAWAFDGNPAQAPLLHVEYTSAPPPPPPDNPPVAALTVAVLASPALTVSADGGASTDTDLTPIAGYRFDFGDGTVAVTTTAPTTTAQHTYAGAGTYTVTLTVTDTGNLVSPPASVSVTVSPPPPPPPDDPPVAALTVTPLASPPLGVSADGSGSTDTDSTPIAGYRFDFGDGTAAVTTSAPVASAQHTYATAGTYTVTLTVTDTGNLTSVPRTAGVTVSAPPPSGGSVDRRVAASTDDAEEFATGSMYLNSSDLELIHDSSDQTVGMRWSSVAIPPGATITAAAIQFAAKEAQSELTNLTLRGEAADNAATFASGSRNISSRARTAASAVWTPVAWSAGQAGAGQRTPDLSAVIQEIVNRPGWASGNALVVIVTGTGHRTAWAWDGNAGSAPLLHVEFGSASPPPGNQAPNGTIDSPASNPAIAAGQSVAFQATGSDPDHNLPLAYAWDFGGGAPNLGSEDPGAVTFATPGTYTVRLTVTDALGLSDPTPDSRTITVGTGAVPVDEVHWTIMGQTAVTIDWRGSETQVHYGLTTAYDRVATAVPPSPMPYSSAGPFQEARIGGLAENTVYHYAIGTGPDHVFKTPPPRGVSGFTVYVEGDIGNATSWPRMGVIQSMIAAGQPDFVLTAGDLTYASPGGQAYVDRHFNDIMVWSQDAADMPAWGNHEWTAPTEDDLRNYKGRFDLPHPQTSPGSPAVSCCGEDWYWFDYGNARFIAYPEEWSGAWTDWNTQVAPLMDQAQQDSAITFIVTFGHKPAYSSGYHSGSTTLKTIMDGLGATYSKYVLNLSGHSHDYERTYPQSGVVHVTAAPGGVNLEESSDPTCLWVGGCPPPAWSAFRAMHHTAVRLHFTTGAIEGTVTCGPAGDTGSNRNDIDCSPGDVIDRFTIGPRPTPAEPPRVASRAANRADTLGDGAVPRAWVSPSPMRGPGVLHILTTEAGRVSATIFDVRGRVVRQLVSGAVLAPGLHQVDWNRRDDRGDPVRSGVYLYQVTMPGDVLSGKILIVR